MKPPTDHAHNVDSSTIERGRASAVSFVVHGQCWSMKNGKAPRKNRPGMVKNAKVRQFERDFLLQVPPEAKKRLGSSKEPLRAIITVYYPSWRQDLDLSVVYDLLQTAGVVSNDRWIRQKFEYAEAVDPQNPRVEIEIERILGL